MMSPILAEREKSWIIIEQLRDYMYNPKNVAQTKYILSKYIEKVVVNNDEATVIFKVLAPELLRGLFPMNHSSAVMKKHLQSIAKSCF